MLRIGLDLDNTLICYDQAFRAAAAERGLIPAGFPHAKAAITAHIRASGDGERAWQALQGYVYGVGIGSAELFPGVMPFLKRARAAGAALFIVSHKTESGHFDASRTNLRDAAREFLRAQGIYAYVPEANLHFGATRSEKLEKIEALGCDIFIDDLEEVLLDPGFPKTTRRFLFSPVHMDKVHTLETAASWAELERSIFEKQ